jgi:hypothetical protein
MIAYSINVGAHLVDVSPLSTLGALCPGLGRDVRGPGRSLPQAHGLGLVHGARGRLVCQLLFGYRR